MKKVKGFNFDIVKDKELMEHIENQPNQSSYIKKLVRKDMNKESIDEIIRRQIEEYMGNIETKTIKKSVQIDTDEIMNILEL